MAQANVITANTTLPGGARTPFPAWYWRADGVSYLANSDAEIEPGSTPYHPDNAPAAKPKADALTLSKKETITQLKAGEIKHDPQASHADLYALLVAGIKNALSTANIEHDANSNDAKALLELFPKE